MHVFSCHEFQLQCVDLDMHIICATDISNWIKDS